MSSLGSHYYWQVGSYTFVVMTSWGRNLGVKTCSKWHITECICCITFFLNLFVTENLECTNVKRFKEYVNNKWINTGCPTRYRTRHCLIILTPMKILQQNLNRSTFFSSTFFLQWGKSASNFVAISSLVVKIIKEMPGSLASWTPCISIDSTQYLR